MYTAGDCYRDNRAPDWGNPGDGSDNPSMTRDDVAFGPETVTYLAPVAGVYTVRAEFFNDNGLPGAARPQMRIYVDGVLAADLPGEVPVRGQIWTAARVEWPSGKVVEVDEVTGP